MISKMKELVTLGWFINKLEKTLDVNLRKNVEHIVWYKAHCTLKKDFIHADFNRTRIEVYQLLKGGLDEK